MQSKNQKKKFNVSGNFHCNLINNNLMNNFGNAIVEVKLIRKKLNVTNVRKIDQKNLF